MENEEVKFNLDMLVLADSLDSGVVQTQVCRQEQLQETEDSWDTQNNIIVKSEK